MAQKYHLSLLLLHLIICPQLHAAERRAESEEYEAKCKSAKLAQKKFTGLRDSLTRSLNSKLQKYGEEPFEFPADVGSIESALSRSLGMGYVNNKDKDEIYRYGITSRLAYSVCDRVMHGDELSHTVLLILNDAVERNVCNVWAEPLVWHSCVSNFARYAYLQRKAREREIQERGLKIDIDSAAPAPEQAFMPRHHNLSSPSEATPSPEEDAQ